jgi:replicative DNA helicase
MGRLAEAPIFIDDSANITLVEIRAKCRRLKAKRGLGLVIVDYLQLMQSPRKSENRQQEVSEISRNLKILARELEVPVLCASQLNRGVEMRADKRPLLGDLRESGCLTADTKIVRADTGQAVPIGRLYEQKERDIPVWTLDEEFKLIRGTMTNVFSSGVKRTFKLRLRSGREIRASANHPFLSFDGWKSLADLTPGEHLAVPRRLGEGSARRWQDASGITPNPNADVLPRSVWDEIRLHMVDQRVTTGQLARDLGISYAGSSLYRSAPSHERLRRITEVIRDRRLESLAQSDVCWDEVVEIAPDAYEEVFDATVPGTHNFVADGMIAHNSIEQDADLVMFLYRDEVYNRDSEARGEAELIVAKHRNGPTDTVKLAFMNQYTKFASLAKVPR